MSRQNFIKGAAVLGAAGLIVKIIGAIYRIPLTNLIGTEGMGLYQPAYNVYNLLLTVSLAGFPTAIARLVSEKRAINNYQGAYQVFKISMVGMFLGGLLTAIIVYINAQHIVDSLGYSGSYYSMIALTPALFFVPIMSTFRGYFQGSQDMVPTAFSQVIEQLFRVSVGLFLAYKLVSVGLEQAAGGAIFGASAGSIAGTILIMIIFFGRTKTIKGEIKKSNNNSLDRTKTVVKRLLAIAIPITIGASIVPVMSLIDSYFVSSRLQAIGYTEAQATDMFGQLSGTAQTLINFPQVFSIAVAMSLVPTITEAYTKKNKSRLNKTANLGARTSLLIGLPSAVGLFILAEPIIALLYPAIGPAKHASVGSLLQILAISVIFLTLVQAFTAILQAVEKQTVPVKNLAIGAVVKIILSYVLIGNPALNVKGAALSTVAAYLIASALNYIDIRRYTNIDINIFKISIKPLISTLIMGIIVFVCYYGTMGRIGSKLAAVIAIAIGIVVYVVALFATGAITEEDLKALPKGEKLIKLLKLRRK